jgi:uncharacterized repeat protein (TIGR01451 family)
MTGWGGQLKGDIGRGLVWLGRRRFVRVSTVAVVAVGLLIALAVPASAHIENPGSFTFSESNASLSLGLVPVPLPAGSMAGQIDSGGNITIPDSALQMTDEPFSSVTDVTVGTVSISGTATVATGSLTGTLDPGSGAATLNTSLFASATFTATLTTILGTSQIYSGTCTIGESANRLPVTLTTDPPGTPYSEQTGSVTLSSNLGNPLACTPDLPSELALVLSGSDILTVPGSTSPILLQDARLSLSPSALDFGDIQVVATSTRPETFTNSGTDPTYITDLVITGDNTFSVTANNCAQDASGFLVPAGGSCSIEVTFQATTIGNHSATLTVKNTSSDGTQQIPLTGTGVNRGMSVDVGSLNFGPQLVGTTSTPLGVTVVSTGTTDLTVTGASASGDFAADASACTAQPIPPEQACVVLVTFSPTASGARTGTLAITSNAASSPAHVSLTGTGIAPAITVSPTSLKFGSVPVGTTSAPQTVTVGNAGSSPLTVSSAGTSGPFAVSDDSCTSAGAIAPGGTCQIAAVFVPTSTGPATGTLTISSDGGTATVALSGNGSPVADLGVSIGASPNPVKRNGTLTYAVTVQNAGPSDAPSTLVSDPLPSNVQFQSLTAPGGSSCVTPAVGATGTVKCNVGTVSAGAIVQLKIVVTVVAPKSTTITDTVKVTTSATDPDLQDNQATVATTVK